MGKDFRYKLEHIGDYFVSMISCAIEAGESAAKGVILTYDIKQLTRQKETLLKRLGMQLAKDKRESINVEQDPTIQELMTQLEEIEQRLQACKDERDKKLNPQKCCCTGQSTDSTMSAQ
ncbi:MAG: hypothetical protein N2738_09690 [Thermodesulfovibrionales bacterium]|nr:hypothetical protein [Thermodesulfovibrionales bacterium]